MINESYWVLREWMQTTTVLHLKIHLMILTLIYISYKDNKIMQWNIRPTVQITRKSAWPEARAEMYRKILVTFLEAIILANVVQVITSYHNRSLHFHFQDYARQYSPTNAHVASKRTFLVNVVTLDCLQVISPHTEITSSTLTISIPKYTSSNNYHTTV